MSLQPSRSTPVILYMIFCAVSMSLGWGLRGTIGGGPVGAMIPGAMIALTISLAFHLKKDLGAILAFCTVGVALGPMPVATPPGHTALQRTPCGP